MPLYQLDYIADAWADSVASTGYFTSQRMSNRARSDFDADEHLKWLVAANGKILMEKVKNWYDKDIP